MHPVEDLERSLLTAPVRRSRSALETLLHPDFIEVGATGRRWSRDELLDALVLEEGADPVEAEQFEVREVTPDVVLLTFLSDPRRRAARRSSIWRCDDGQRRMLYHQGTPLPHREEA